MRLGQGAAAGLCIVAHVMNAALALLVNCPCDLTEEGKEVYEAFRAEVSPTVYRGADGSKVVFPASQAWGPGKIPLRLH